MPTVLLLLECGLFLFLPAMTFAGGLWLIKKIIGIKNRNSLILISLVIGVSFFEASAIGMLMDPRGGFSRLAEIMEISALIGVGVVASILLFVPLFRWIIKFGSDQLRKPK